MLKGLFFSLPSTSINNTLIPFVDKMARNGYKIVFYDTVRPAGNYYFDCKLYPVYHGGYNSNCIVPDISFFRFAELLIDTTTCLMDFLIEEVHREKPDFILHPHLALWAKLLAVNYRIPAIMLSSTFIMDSRVMAGRFRRSAGGSEIDFHAIKSANSFNRKSEALCKRFNFQTLPDIWDARVNREEFNIVFVDQELQPPMRDLTTDIRFVGFPLSVAGERKGDTIYISLGTMLNDDMEFYRICLGAVERIGMNCILSVGKKVNIESLGNIPANVKVIEFVDQVKVLARAKLFITSGGMASVQEAIATITPMIVIPQTPEQSITAERIEKLGLGMQLDRRSCTVSSLYDAIVQATKCHAMYQFRLGKKASDYLSKEPTENAFRLIDDYLKHVLKL